MIMKRPIPRHLRWWAKRLFQPGAVACKQVGLIARHGEQWMAYRAYVFSEQGIKHRSELLAMHQMGIRSYNVLTGELIGKSFPDQLRGDI